MTYILEVLDGDKTYVEQKKFNCGHSVIDKFVRDSLRQQVRASNSVAWVLLDTSNNDRFIGFYTLMMSQVDQSLLEATGARSLPKMVPCARLVMLGVDSRYKGNKLGLRLLKHAIGQVKIAAATLGCRGLYLDADCDAVEFYQKYGFQKQEEPSSPTSSTPMFLFTESFF